MIFVFHPKLHLSIIVVFRSFQQNQDQLFDLSHLNDKSSFALSELLSTKLKFTIDLLVKWFKQEYKSRFLETDALTKEKYEKLNRYPENDLLHLRL